MFEKYKRQGENIELDIITMIFYMQNAIIVIKAYIT